MNELPLAHGIMNTSATDRNGFDKRARVMVKLIGGKWKWQGD